jgi:hypothetical protein
MKRIYLALFQKRFKALLKKYPSLDRDFNELLNRLETLPQSGISLGNDCYKIRLAIRSKGRGKSGGARVITCVKLLAGRIYFLTIYDKSEQASITDVTLAILLENVDEMEKGSSNSPAAGV